MDDITHAELNSRIHDSAAGKRDATGDDYRNGDGKRVSR